MIVNLIENVFFFLMKKRVYQSLNPWPFKDAFNNATLEVQGRLEFSFSL